MPNSKSHRKRGWRSTEPPEPTETVCNKLQEREGYVDCDIMTVRQPISYALRTDALPLHAVMCGRRQLCHQRLRRPVMTLRRPQKVGHWSLSLGSAVSTCPCVCLSRCRPCRGRLLVPLHVLLTVDGCAEALLTEGTLVGLHAHVRRHVPGEAAVGRERSVADTAAECLHTWEGRNTVNTAETAARHVKDILLIH